MNNYTRKKLADKLGIGIETLRYYEKTGLMPSPARSANGYRIYSEEDVTRMEHILTAKKYGFSIKELKIVFDMAKKNGFTTEEMKSILINKMKEIDIQINDLNNYKILIQQLIQSY